MGVSLSRGELLKGARFGQHEIVRLVGHGATASVFEARHVLLGKRVALKVLHDHLAADPDVSRRFVREGTVAAQLRHPHVVDVQDVGVEGGVPYLVMELLQGRDLSSLLKERTRLPLVEALALLLPILSAVAHAHEMGAVHRDLKPSNIFLAEEPLRDLVPKVVDFGLSKIDGESEGPPLTATSTVVGTVQYMPPEQTKGSKFATAKSDQYSLAVIIYQCTTGRLPFAKGSLLALLDAIRSEPVPPPTLVDPRLPETLDGVLARAMHRDEERRFPDVRAFGAALLPLASEREQAAWRREFDPTARAGSARERAVALPEANDGQSGRRRAAAREEIESASASPSVRTMSESRSVPELPCAPGVGPFHIKGIAYRGFLHLVEHRIPGGMPALLAEIADVRIHEFLKTRFLASSRYDILPLMPLNVAAARLLGKPLSVLARETGAGQGLFDARGVYKSLVGSRGLEDLESRLPRFGALYYDFGTFTGRLVAPGHVLVRRTELPVFIHDWYAPMQAAYVEAIVRELGASFVETTLREPAPSAARGPYPLCVLDTDIRWRP